ncbi:MAG: hypothetical protein RID81_07155 [Sandaracinaceae bacterium]
MARELDQQEDPQAEALAALLAGAVRAELGEDLVQTVYTRPIPLSTIPGMRLPALAVWRKRETRKAHSTNRRRRRVTFRVDYIADRTPLDRLEGRWPSLQSVWRRVLEALEAGQHAEVLDGAPILEAAGFEWLEPESPAVDYAFAPDGKQAYPGFQGEAILEHRHPIDTSTLVDAVCLIADLFPPGLEEAERPLVQVRAETPTP